MALVAMNGLDPSGNSNRGGRGRSKLVESINHSGVGPELITKGEKKN